jgi:hypothetical protein
MMPMYGSIGMCCGATEGGRDGCPASLPIYNLPRLTLFSLQYDLAQFYWNSPKHPLP